MRIEDEGLADVYQGHLISHLERARIEDMDDQTTSQTDRGTRGTPPCLCAKTYHAYSAAVAQIRALR